METPNGGNSVELLFGVQGGGSISGESGKKILSEIKSIVQEIEDSGTTHLKFSVDNSDIKEFQNNINNTVNKIKSTSVSPKMDYGSLDKYGKTLDSVYTNLEQLNKGYTRVGFSVSNFNKKTEQGKATFTLFNSETQSTQKYTVDLTKKLLEAADAQKILNEAVISGASSMKAQQSAQQKSSNVKVKFNGSQSVINNFSDKINSAEDYLQFNNASQLQIDNLNKIKSAFEELKLIQSRWSGNRGSKELQAEFIAQKEALSRLIKEYDTYRVKNEQVKNLENTRSEAIRKVTNQYQLYEEKIKKLPDLLNKYETTLNKLNDPNIKNSSDIKSILSDWNTYFDKSGVKVQSFSEKMKNLFGARFDYTLAGIFSITAFNNARKMYQAVVDIDTAMTELKKVTNETDSTYEKFLNNASKRAEQLGATISDTVTATADYARLGYNLEDSSKLADASIVYKNVGDGISDISTASESIISTMKAFNIEANDAMSIVDKFNEVGNNFSISSYGIGEALQRSAGALAAAGNTLEESIGLAVAMNNVTQDPEKVGTALKTSSMYLRAAKTEAEEAGLATDGMANSVSELRKEILNLTGQKVDIMVDEKNFKSTYQIYKELSTVWNDLSDINKANILKQIGGKRNASTISSLLKTFSDAQSATETAANSSGSALKENEKYLDSINGKIAQFKATFQSLSDNTLDSGIVKTFIDIGTWILKGADALQEWNILLPSIIAGFLSIKKNIGKLVTKDARLRSLQFYA